MNLSCPACHQTMEDMRHQDLRLGACARCGGYALTVPTLRKLVHPDSWASIWTRLRGAPMRSPRACPSCRKPMRKTHPVPEVGAVVMDICMICRVVWLDRGEAEMFPARPEEPDETLSLEARELLGRHKVQLLEERGAFLSRLQEIADRLREPHPGAVRDGWFPF